jgi:hypothetical protein
MQKNGAVFTKGSTHGSFPSMRCVSGETAYSFEELGQ